MDSITPADLERWRGLRVSDEFIAWAACPSRTRAEVVETHPEWLLEHDPTWLTDAEFNRCVELIPGEALLLEFDRLSEEQRDRCAELAPWAAFSII